MIFTHIQMLSQFQQLVHISHTHIQMFLQVPMTEELFKWGSLQKVLYVIST